MTGKNSQNYTEYLVDWSLNINVRIVENPLLTNQKHMNKDTPQSNTDFAKEYVGRMTFVNDFLRKTYGLNDNDTLNAGEVEELCEMLVSQLLEAEKKKWRSEVADIYHEELEPVSLDGNFCVDGNDYFPAEDVHAYRDAVLQKLS